MRGKEGPRGSQEERTAPSPTDGGGAVVLLLVGGGQHTSKPAWLSAGTDKPARVRANHGGGTQMGRGHLLATAVEDQVGVSQPLEHERQKAGPVIHARQGKKTTPHDRGFTAICAEMGTATGGRGASSDPDAPSTEARGGAAGYQYQPRRT